mgnify:FL=1|jgi:hypothetical protein
MPARNQQSRDWFRNKAKTTGVSDTKLMREATRDRLRTRVAMGNMYLFQYDAKHKKTLPYFDRFPLIFPFAKAPGGFLGMNLHYLPYRQRAILMDALYETANNDRYDESTKLRLSYDVLNGASRFKWFLPTVHHYLTPHVRSRFLYIAPSEWDIALFLNVQNFGGANRRTVWSDSRKMV